MHILYLHGLDSKLNPEKRQFLEEYGSVHAPDIDYSLAYLQPERILEGCPDTEINVVMGSSMGALNAFAISGLIGRPALLFNPPLHRYQPSGEDYLPKYPKTDTFKQFLLGGKDQVVDPKETLAFLAGRLQEDELYININPRLGHRIPLDVFDEEISSFFSRFCL